MNVLDDIVRPFENLYHRGADGVQPWKDTKWLGVPILQMPSDMFVMAEIIYRERPDYIVETGAKHGGSAVFFATICQLIGHGYVFSIEFQEPPEPDASESIRSRIKFRQANSIDCPDVIAELIGLYNEGEIYPKSFLVFLDSAHSTKHVLAEMEIYWKFLSPGGYLIVCDTVMGRPKKAVNQFLKDHEDFEIDPEFHRKHLATFNTILRRKPNL